MAYYQQVSFTIGDYNYNNYNNDSSDSGVRCVPADKTKTTYSAVPQTVTYNGTTYDVIEVSFSGCKNLTAVPVCNANFRLVPRPSYYFGGIGQCFRGCESLTDVSEFANWHLTNIIDLSVMFDGCTLLSNISALASIDVSNIEDMQGMFKDCSSLSNITPLANWDTSSVFCAHNMFYGTAITNTSALANWDLSSVDTNSGHLYDTTKSGINHMFAYCSALTDISALANWSVNNVERMRGLFRGCENLSDITALSGWNVSSITDMSYMFLSTAIANTTALSGWNVSSVTDMQYMFSGCANLSNITALSNWNVGSVTTMHSMFKSCSSLSDITALSGWNVGSVTYTQSMFQDCSSLMNITALSNWNVGSVIGMARTFRGTAISDITPLSNWNVSSVMIMQGVFYECANLSNITPLANWDTSGVTDMSYMFYGCANLSDITPLAGWDMSAVSNTYAMFYATNASGNFVTNCAPTTYSYMFAQTVNKNDIYIIDNGSASVATLKDIASSNSYVHYEADDNPVPSLSMIITRVGAVNSETPAEAGEYAYINATVVLSNAYLPDGWAVALNTETLTLDSVTQSPTWTITSVSYTYTLKCWLSLGDILKHTFTLQVSDSITENNVAKASHLSALITKVLGKAYKLVDYYHESDPNSPAYDTEGMAVGKFATEANLFDVDMPSRFRDTMLVDHLVGEIKMWAGNTAPTGWLVCDGSAISRTDYPLLFDAIGTLWGTGDGSTTFNLPNLKGKVPVGYDSSQTEFNTVGESGGAKSVTLTANQSGVPAHGHGNTFSLSNRTNVVYSTDAVGATRANITSSNSASKSIIYKNYNASGTAGKHDIALSGGVSNNTASNASEAHTNLQPYAVVKYIICAV